ncbi:acyl-CoA desaturase 1-like isoform X2 [Neoarius graeffei]|uniref:acyl-CoA desaturase 1-like isoform X2 n=1 Tax=Neoarius graeffei TaxID=443677 RepID=UPI00298D59FB|nr:acyl-CoA desaturase 1-like isoform X2 [Neoarius graeffei]
MAALIGGRWVFGKSRGQTVYQLLSTRPASSASQKVLPGPYPRTAEERAAAAKKYNLRLEDYQPYPDDGRGALGVTAGAHRLWSHRSYKASLPLRIFLAVANSMAFQNDIYEWSRDHRVHHKYSETDADPHNASRGFFFAHIGWLLVRKHPNVIKSGQKLELSDLKNDGVVMFQRRFYKPSVVVMCFLIPAVLPWFLWAESLWVGFFVPTLLRYMLVLNATWLVNSAAHMWGNRPYDVHINPRENNFVAFSAIGEGFHNYHHTFPYDYSTSEFRYKLNLTTCFIDLMCVLGLAKDRRRVPTELVMARAKRTGDGSHRSG